MQKMYYYNHLECVVSVALIYSHHCASLPLPSSTIFATSQKETVYQLNDFGIFHPVLFQWEFFLLICMSSF